MPSFDATIDRRVLLNYRADPGAAAATLPRPLRPQIVDGSAVVGVCILRTRSLRPPGAPAFIGRTADSIAVRVAVEWDAPVGVQRAVYVGCRLTAARPASIARRVPGVHGAVNLRHDDRGDELATLALDASGSVIADVCGTIGASDELPRLPHGAAPRRPLFADTTTAEHFFAAADGMVDVAR